MKRYENGNIILAALFTLIAICQGVHAQPQLSQSAFAIFQQNCLVCHGADGAFRETLLMEHSELIDGGTVVPGNLDASELYKRLLGPTENGAQMPLGQPPLPAQSIDTIRQWILSGALDWSIAPPSDRRFITHSDILGSIETHINSLPSFDRPFARYFNFTHLYNAGESADILKEYRKALSKLINSLSWGVTITNPEPIDREQNIYYIDLRRYEWDRNNGWTQIEQVYPYHIAFNTQATLRSRLQRIQQLTTTDKPVVNADWFIATAASPPLYNELLSLPATDRQLEDRLEVDVNDNILTAPGIRVARAGFNNSGVSNHNRVVERHTSRYGAYWKSYDFAGSVGTQNIFTHPLAFTHDGGEIIFNLPNGLQGYYLVDGDGFRLDEAPISIVSNPAASDPTVRNGLSCIGCHTEGMKEIDDQVRAVIQETANPAYNKNHALRLYVADDTMDSLVMNDTVRYQRALELTGGALDDIEPVSRFHEAFQRAVDAAHAAAAVGLPTESFLEKVRVNAGLQAVGLLVLDSENGSIKRDTWTSSFQEIIDALDYPQQIGDVPVDTQPDLLPGRPVTIPDPNLKALLEETLDTRRLTVGNMLQLTTLKAKGRDISDLTGLEYAINLEEIWLSENPATDLSPLAKCTNLIRLFGWNTNFSELSPLANLTNLEELEIKGGGFRDISSLAKLTNLRVLKFYGPNIADISVVANMKRLKELQFRHNSDLTDISPIAGLTNLVSLDLAFHHASDLSPLKNLTKLETLEITGKEELTNIEPLRHLINLIDLELRFNITNTHPSDISPLAGLTSLKRLEIFESNLTDISPLANLTNLELLNLSHNRISDISPLTGLTRLRHLNLRTNQISDVSPLAGLPLLEHLNLSGNRISDASPLKGLVSLGYLNVSYNLLYDVTPLMSIKDLILAWDNNPGFSGGPKIKGPWLWVAIPGADLADHRDVDFLSRASDGAVTEVKVSTHGATEGKAVGDHRWESHTLTPSSSGNIRELFSLPRWLGVIYGCISLYSPREQNTTMYLGNDEATRVWLNGAQVFETFRREGLGSRYEFSFPITLRRGRNVLMVAVASIVGNSGISVAFGFAKDTDYEISNPSVGHALSRTSIHAGDKFTFDVLVENVHDLAGWQFDIGFDSSRLETTGITEGDFLKSDGGSTFFQSGQTNTAPGKITGLIAGRISEGGVSGSGSLLKVEFKAKSEGETELALQNLLLGSATGGNIPVEPLRISITVEEHLLTGDANRDGVVNILDLIIVAQQLGTRQPPDSPTDINGDGIVNIFDLTLIAQGIGAAAPASATSRVTPPMVQAWIAEARLANDGSMVFREGIRNLETLLASLLPDKSALLPNYPNPFNPETWIPYRLAAPAEVALTIRDTKGNTVRRVEVGVQAAGIYESRGRAAYWDGKTEFGEYVASGLYFYTIQAGGFTATRKMLIMK